MLTHARVPLLNLSLPNGPGLLLGRLRRLEAVPVYAQLSYFGFECLSGNSQLNGGAGWTFR